jgi:uracil-DNA glycosylase family 4
VNADERRQALQQVAAEVAVCTRCPLHEQRTLAVPGEGHPDTEVVFVGEGPGYNEDQQGRPFVGAAGSLLNELLKTIGWKRQEVFITNVVKCRPPGNRDPEPAEIAACAPYLRRQLQILDPAVVVTLGRHSLGHFNPGARIGATHGTLRPVDPETGAQNALGYALYHPAAALRQGSLKRTMIEDICALPDALLESRRRRSEAVPQPSAEVDQQPTEPATRQPTEAFADDVATQPVAIDIERDAVTIHVEPEEEPVDENQMHLFG